MFCPNCGSNILAGTGSCSDCGALVFIDSNGKVGFSLPPAQPATPVQPQSIATANPAAAGQIPGINPQKQSEQNLQQVQNKVAGMPGQTKDSLPPANTSLTPEQHLTLDTPIRPELDAPAKVNKNTWVIVVVVVLALTVAVLFGFMSGLIPPELFGINTGSQQSQNEPPAGLQATDVLQQQNESQGGNSQEEEPLISLLSATPPLPSKNPVDTTWSFSVKSLDSSEKFSYPELVSTGDTAIVEWLNARNQKLAQDALESSKASSQTSGQATVYESRNIQVTRFAAGYISFIDTGSESTEAAGSYAFINGMNYNIVNGDSLTPAQLAGLSDQELNANTVDALTTYIANHPKEEWWDEDLDADFVSSFVHYFVIEDGVCAAVTENALGSQSLGMLTVFVEPFDAKESAYKRGDEVVPKDIVQTSGTSSLTADEISDML